jgi:formylglycine-generating enzyme required for sulfatase activity
MRNPAVSLIPVVLALMGLAAPAHVAAACPPDSVQVGPLCVDKYEASAWSIPASHTLLIQKVQNGNATLANLLAGGAKQHGCATGQIAYPASFGETGNWTVPVYAVSVAVVLPSACITWFQAEQACALSGKRLLTNQEWQRSAAGTPDSVPLPGNEDCNTGFGGLDKTGTRATCRSAWGVFDMVGNVWEWVGDWGVLASGCTTWPFGGDLSCMGPPSASSYPGAMFRGGGWGNDLQAGVLAVASNEPPSFQHASVGFRCAH